MGIIALIGLTLVLRPGILCGIANIGCESGFARDCLRASGATTEFAPGLSPSGESFSAHLGGKEEIQGAKNEKELELILACVERAHGGANQIKDDYATRQTIPLGLVQAQWTEGEVALSLLEPADQTERDHLMNLAFGPAAGKRQEIIESWCDNNAGCVTCQTADDAQSYSVSLKPSASFSKAFVGTAPLAGHRKTLYQLVEADDSLDEGVGRRVIYQCATP